MIKEAKQGRELKFPAYDRMINNADIISIFPLIMKAWAKCSPKSLGG